MPYDYRKLTPEERAAVLIARRNSGFPLHSPPHTERKAGIYLITAATYDHLPLLMAPARCTAFEAAILEKLHKNEIIVFAWVILPNHYHFLAQLTNLSEISQTLKLVHGRSSRQWNAEDKETGKRKAWYHYSDRLIRNE